MIVSRLIFSTRPSKSLTLLTYFTPIFYFYIPGKSKKTKDFTTFSGSIEMENWCEIFCRQNESFAWIISSFAKAFNTWWTLKGHRYLTLSWRRPLSYRNQSIDLQSKSMDWFLYDKDLRHERVKKSCSWNNAWHLSVTMCKRVKIIKKKNGKKFSIWSHRSSCPGGVLLNKAVLKNFAKLTGKHLCQSLYFNKVAGLSLQINKKVNKK